MMRKTVDLLELITKLKRDHEESSTSSRPSQSREANE